MAYSKPYEVIIIQKLLCIAGLRTLSETPVFRVFRKGTVPPQPCLPGFLVGCSLKVLVLFISFDFVFPRARGVLVLKLVCAG